jgi:hypothetical protein
MFVHVMNEYSHIIVRQMLHRVVHNEHFHSLNTMLEKKGFNWMRELYDD